MPLNFPTSPSANMVYTYNGASYIYDNVRWKPLTVEYTMSGANVSASANNVTLDLSRGNLFSVNPVNAYVQIAFANATSSGQNFSVKVGTGNEFYTGWSVGTASYDNASTLVSAQTTSPHDIQFKPDGTKMYVLGLNEDRIYQYSLSTAWDITSASYDSISYLISQDSNPRGFTLKPDGTKLYVVGLITDRIYQYTLSTPWNISTAAYDNVSYLVTNDSIPASVSFDPTGRNMYVLGYNGKVVMRFFLSTAWNLSSVTFIQSFSVNAQDTDPQQVAFNDTGTRMFMLGGTNDRVYEYTLPTAWTLTAASYSGVSFSVGSQDTQPKSFTFRSDNGFKMYVVGDANDRIFQYSSSNANSVPTIGWSDNISWETGSAPAAPDLGSDSIYYFNTSDGGTSYYGKLLLEDLTQ